jgi:hypothetical protein
MASVRLPIMTRYSSLVELKPNCIGTDYASCSDASRDHQIPWTIFDCDSELERSSDPSDLSPVVEADVRSDGSVYDPSTRGQRRSSQGLISSSRVSQPSWREARISECRKTIKAFSSRQLNSIPATVLRAAQVGSPTPLEPRMAINEADLRLEAVTEVVA